MLWLARFEAGDVRALLPRATVMMGVPTFYTRLLALSGFGAADCRSVRLFVSGSAPLLPETFAQFRARTGCTILSATDVETG
jgi:malonyl-CoA/methylmalonyl-CoA synthetase